MRNPLTASVAKRAGPPPPRLSVRLWRSLVKAGAVGIADLQCEPNDGTPEEYAAAALRAAFTPRAMASVVTAVGSPESAADRRWNEAVDWLLNSRHTADPDIQGPFWAYVDGEITRKELDDFSAEDVSKRQATAEIVEHIGMPLDELTAAEQDEGPR